ncbi:MAG TPA: hypothetical protein PKD17_01430 [Cellvibrionaceae bacterium]|nr:hypothetical protein [Cellvibrionaceae bacterium]HMW70447.1 hypothetical protein [Cellvibrionaceae bacterium]HMY39173.1 hypothetical protein [Marinagarivorans sp.]HNG59832.1 hypothetical protein [Cellvibrionaceae bacterium]
MATLVPDESTDTGAYWTLDYVYKAGCTVNIRCGYADKTSVDINLAEKIQKCSYKIDAMKKSSVLPIEIINFERYIKG